MAVAQGQPSGARKAPAHGFDRIAPHFEWLERLALGRAMERARVALLDAACEALPEAPRALLAGEGDGRFASELLERRPLAEVDVVDASAVMLARAQARLEGSGRGLERVRFRQTDLTAPEASESRSEQSASNDDLPASSYDLIVTCFLLDCFEGERLDRVIRRLARAAGPCATWLQVDFQLPERGAARALGRVQLGVLYAFFRGLTGLDARRLENPGPRLEAQGFSVAQEARLRGGTLGAELRRRDRGA